MGKKRKQNGGNKHDEARKRRKSKNGARCWVESTKGNRFPKAGCPNGSLIINISRIELADDHTHGGEGADQNTKVHGEESNDQKESVDTSPSAIVDRNDAESGKSEQLEPE